MKNVNPMMVVAVLLWVVCGAAWAGGSIEFSGGFSGGTVPNAVVLTGDNASGTGTLRIRPADEDTHVVLCEASNNAATEVCSSLSHQNISATASLTYVADNGYSDSAGTFTRYNTGFGAATFRAAASSTQAQNFTAQNVYSTNGTHSGDLSLIVTGVGTSTFYSGASTTVTNDFRGPILNGGSATCDGLLAGSVCITDPLTVHTASNAASLVGVVVQNTSNSGSTGYQAYTDGDAFAFQLAYGNGAVADADFAVRDYLLTSATTVMARTDDVGSTAAWMWVDGTSVSSTLAGTTLMELEGDGSLDVRGPLKNDGNATCNTIAAGSLCHFEETVVFYGGGAVEAIHIGSSAANSSTQIWEYTQGTAGQATTLFVTGTMGSPTVVAGVGYYGSTYADADYADDAAFTGVGKEISFIRTDNPAAGAIHTKWTDDASASATLAGTTLMTLDGAGNLFLNAAATRSKGTKVLAAGTGTVTVASGSICTCTDTTAVAAVQCSVATTTLTINGTGTDTIAYLCL